MRVWMDGAANGILRHILVVVLLTTGKMSLLMGTRGPSFAALAFRFRRSVYLDLGLWTDTSYWCLSQSV